MDRFGSADGVLRVFSAPTLSASPPIKKGAPVDHSRAGDASVLKAGIHQIDPDCRHVAARIDRDFVSDGVAVIGRWACIR